ncbi:hypothetical protein AB0J21_14300 [Streptomyces sp. NPDC049954]|uniref:hypothetical protein n=1 Tax=Streptomyces sp. NPDC049954 TaxID=3155779 RepID=UPI003432B572
MRATLAEPVGRYVRHLAWAWGTGIVTKDLGDGKVYVQFVRLGAVCRCEDLALASREEIAAAKSSLPERGTSWLDV